jgi:hypothetical protein
MVLPVENYREGLEILTRWQEEILTADPENPNPWFQVRLSSLIQTTENTIKLLERIDLLVALLDKISPIDADMLELLES